MLPENQKRWMIPEPLPEETAGQLADFPPIIRQILFNRGFSENDSARNYLLAKEPKYDPFLLKDMKITVARILKAIDSGEKIAVYGDYDVDGVTATALLVQVIRALGGSVREYIPNRFEEGYGLNEQALETLKEEEKIDLVITVDCGIRSTGEAAFARRIGLEMIISDHHHPGEEMPAAAAVICHRQPGDEYPEKNLAGVGLAYKIAQALLARRPKQGLEADDWLDLVALGTVADIVPLTGENRTLVRAGLRSIRQGKRQGIYSLIQVAGLSKDKITARDIGFMLGPRLNASGRLESALASFNLLMAEDVETAGLMAQQLDDQNKSRQKLTKELEEIARQMVGDGQNENILFAFGQGFNSGLVGLAAARMVETYYRPVIVGEINGEFTRASCRSIDEFHITDALDACADLMVRHGGHAKAAGFTVLTKNLEELRFRLKAIADQSLADVFRTAALRADCEISLDDLTPEVFQWLDFLEPTGNKNPEAVFVSRDLKVLNKRKIGSDGQHLKMRVKHNQLVYDAIAFRSGGLFDEISDTVDLIYSLDKNEYQGLSSWQLKVKDIKLPGMGVR
jgi:single-stranded-DNA-specific exonuclease